MLTSLRQPNARAATVWLTAGSCGTPDPSERNAKHEHNGKPHHHWKQCNYSAAQRFLPDLTFTHDRVSAEQIFLCPLDGFVDRDGYFLIQVVARKFGKLEQRRAFSVAQLRFRQRQQFCAAQILLLQGSFSRGELGAQGLKVCTSKIRFFLEQFGESFVNSGMPLGKPFTQFIGDAFILLEKMRQDNRRKS